jgi:hypothetical protein
MPTESNARKLADIVNGTAGAVIGYDEAASDDAGGNAEGRAWMVNQNSLVDDERTKL